MNDDTDEDLDDDFDEDDLPPEVQSDCRCGECCRRLIIEVGTEDAEREPRIREKGSPIYLPPELTRTGQKELAGYLLNSPENGHACAFLDQQTNLCGIYETRPWTCRAFDCDGEGKERLMLPPGTSRAEVNTALEKKTWDGERWVDDTPAQIQLTVP
jgi:Fe-S-cluster containining protein